MTGNRLLFVFVLAACVCGSGDCFELLRYPCSCLFVVFASYYKPTLSSSRCEVKKLSIFLKGRNDPKVTRWYLVHIVHGFYCCFSTFHCC